MEPVGMTKACTSVVVPNSRSRMVMAHSAIVPRGGSCFKATSTVAGSTTAVLPRSPDAFISRTLSYYRYLQSISRRPPKPKDFPQRDIDINQPESAQRSSKIGALPNRAHPGGERSDGVGVPVIHPGKDQQEYTHFETDNDK